MLENREGGCHCGRVRFAQAAERRVCRVLAAFVLSGQTGGGKMQPLLYRRQFLGSARNRAAPPEPTGNAGGRKPPQPARDVQSRPCLRRPPHLRREPASMFAWNSIPK